MTRIVIWLLTAVAVALLVAPSYGQGTRATENRVMPLTPTTPGFQYGTGLWGGEQEAIRMYQCNSGCIGRENVGRRFCTDSFSQSANLFNACMSGVYERSTQCVQSC